MPLALAGALCVLVFVALAWWCQRAPIVVATVAGVVSLLLALTPYAATITNSVPVTVPVIVAAFGYAYELGALRRWTMSLAGLVPLTVGLAMSVGMFNPLIEMLTIGPWAVGLAMAGRRRLARLLDSRAAELAAERDVFAAQSVRYERARIARELHDIVAHCVSLMVVQATAGERLAAADPDAAADAFDSISEAAQQAEVELARLVEVLQVGSPRQPTSGLRIVQQLVSRARGAGLRVSCELSGDLDDMSAVGAETAYRLVQEAVTNAIKHAPGAPISIALHGLSDRVDVDIVNKQAAVGHIGLESSGGGHGLRGMRERVARCGGTFSAGPAAAGGWVVVASLPRHTHDRAEQPTWS
jgi:signal transduction histidine kinase